MREFFIGFVLGVGCLSSWIAFQEPPGKPPQQQGQVKTELLKVIDGDTVELSWRPEHHITSRFRLLRINTPERGQPLYSEASRTLSDLISGKTLTLEPEENGKLLTDNYGRFLVYLLADGKNMNIEMIRLGMSKQYTKYGAGKYAKLFEDAEKEAKENRRGLWK